MLKYQQSIDSLQLTLVCCPECGATSRTGEAFRFVSLPANSPANFLPRPLEPGVPPRRISIPSDLSQEQLVKEETTRCNEWGLSMFESEQAARLVFTRYLYKFLPHTHIAKIIITPRDGVCTKPNQSRHFDLHQFPDADLSQKVQVVLPI